MKELITEEQADQIILILSILVTLGSLIWGFYQSRQSNGQQKKLNWVYAGISAVIGPAIWIFWLVYNSIENFYGLDSLKALKYNFFIAIGLGVLFYILFTYGPRWAGLQPASSKKP